MRVPVASHPHQYFNIVYLSLSLFFFFFFFFFTGSSLLSALLRVKATL